MANPAINFRNTSGYVTDGTGETYSINGDTYPTVRDSQTFGLSSGTIDTANRDSGQDRRIAGINHHANNGSQSQYRMLLDASGTYDCRIALGDAGGGQAYQYLQIKDNDSTTLLTLDISTGTANNEFVDAAGNKWDQADWPGSNVAVELTFTTANVYMYLGTPDVQSASSTIAHISFTPVTADAPLVLYTSPGLSVTNP
jgi:hypothetical protein